MHITWGLASLDIFFILGLLCLFAMGNYQEAIKAVRPQGQIKDDNQDDNQLALDEVEYLGNGNELVHIEAASQSNTVPLEDDELVLRAIT